MKGKELLKVVTKTVFSLSLSMFCITQSSSKKCNFASKKTMEKEKMKLLFYLKRRYAGQKREKVPSWDASVSVAQWFSSVANVPVHPIYGTVANKDLWARVLKPYQ